ncbi:hypothetical protein N836_14345 [Leptolyngbya sp. Heron Island J]|nr:hypothetical protein N836_14345 [Leptolyngbya sp. Heron Island J]
MLNSEMIVILVDADKITTGGQQNGTGSGNGVLIDSGCYGTLGALF